MDYQIVTTNQHPPGRADRGKVKKMHAPKNFSKIIDGRRYNVATSTLLASDEIWDGHNYERHGRNCFLYKTKGGAYFRVTLTQWQGERDSITALDRDEAMSLYESLPEHNVEYEQAFDTQVEEAAAPGRPTMHGEKMCLISIYLLQDQIEWLAAQTGGAGETIRTLIDRARE